MIDITGLNQTAGYNADATYALRVTYNPARKVVELDYANNAARVTFVPATLPVRS